LDLEDSKVVKKSWTCSVYFAKRMKNRVVCRHEQVGKEKGIEIAIRDGNFKVGVTAGGYTPKHKERTSCPRIMAPQVTKDLGRLFPPTTKQTLNSPPTPLLSCQGKKQHPT
jgi:hypothetical protein